MAYYRLKYLNQIDKGKWKGKIIHIDENGKQKAKTKRFIATCERDARRQRDEWWEEEELAKQKESTGGNSEVCAYLHNFIDTKEAAKDIEPGTAKGYRHMMKHIAAEFEGQTLKDITTQQAQQWVNNLNAAGYSASTTGKSFRLLKQALDHAVRMEELQSNPLAYVKPPKRTNKKQGINAYDAQGRERLLKALGAMDLTPITVGAYISLYTGMRRGEVCALQWRDIDNANGVIWVKRAIGEGKHGTYIKAPKTDKTRDVVYPAPLRSILDEWKASQRATYRSQLAELNSNSYVIGDPLGYYCPTLLTKGWNSIAHAIGVKGTEGRIPVFHDLRHTWATMFLANGGDVKTAASNLGHANAAMTLNIYTSADPDAKKRAARIIEEAI